MGLWSSPAAPRENVGVFLLIPVVTSLRSRFVMIMIDCQKCQIGLSFYFLTKERKYCWSLVVIYSKI